MAEPVYAGGIVKRFLRGSGFRRPLASILSGMASEFGIARAAAKRFKLWDNHKPEVLFSCKPGAGGASPAEGKQHRNKGTDLGFGTDPARIGALKTCHL